MYLIANPAETAVPLGSAEKGNEFIWLSVTQWALEPSILHIRCVFGTSHSMHSESPPSRSGGPLSMLSGMHAFTLG